MSAIYRRVSARGRRWRDQPILHILFDNRYSLRYNAKEFVKLFPEIIEILFPTPGLDILTRPDAARARVSMTVQFWLFGRHPPSLLCLAVS